jgi:hypothetical protein
MRCVFDLHLLPDDVLAHPYLGTGANFIDDGDFVIFIS